jgi:hypothetical protein
MSFAEVMVPRLGRCSREYRTDSPDDRLGEVVRTPGRCTVRASVPAETTL